MNYSFVFGNIHEPTCYAFKTPLCIAYGNLESSTLVYNDNTVNYEDPLHAFNAILEIQKKEKLYLGLVLSYEFGELCHKTPGNIYSPYQLPAYLLYAFDTNTSYEKNIQLPKKKKNHIDIKKYADITKDEYLNLILEVKNLISEGESYQVNLSQSFSIPLSLTDPRIFFDQLMEQHATAYSAFVNLEYTDTYKGAIFSHSPELFLERKKNTLVTKPIKGTRRRDKNPIIDNQLKNELSLSIKDRAELAMIVDLERNDISQICTPGSVTVVSHAETIERSNVFHLESTIQGKILRATNFIDILKATFPCGSITGAPKYATRKIIKHLEKKQRGVYTGSIGLIKPNSDFTLSVAIRSGFINDNYIYFNSGGGITLSSIPSEEYEETLHKASAIKETLSYFI